MRKCIGIGTAIVIAILLCITGPPPAFADHATSLVAQIDDLTDGNTTGIAATDKSDVGDVIASTTASVDASSVRVGMAIDETKFDPYVMNTPDRWLSDWEIEHKSSMSNGDKYTHLAMVRGRPMALNHELSTTTAGNVTWAHSITALRPALQL